MTDENNEKGNGEEKPKEDLQKEVAEMLSLNTFLRGGDDGDDDGGTVENEKSTHFEGIPRADFMLIHLC